MEKDENLIVAVKILIQKRKIIFGFSIVVGFLVAGASLFMPNYYKASTTFLAASPDQAIPDLALGLGKREAQIYGGLGDINRILTVAQSENLENYLIQEFNLIEHYNIDLNHKKAKIKVKEKLRDYLTITKTDKDAIEISVEDKDPILAANIANSARDKIDQISQNLLKASQKNLLSNYDSKIAEKEKLLRTLNDSLYSLRNKYSIFNGVAQTESLTNLLNEASANLSNYQAAFQYLSNKSGIPLDTLNQLEAKITGLKAETNALSGKLSKMNEGLSSVKALEDNFNNIAVSLNYENDSRTRLLTFIEAKTPALILIEPAQVPIIKSRPKRSLLTIGATLAAFFFSTMGILFFESVKKYNFG